MKREQDREKEREQYDSKERKRSKTCPSVQAVFGVTGRMCLNQLITLLTFEPGDENLQF